MTPAGQVAQPDTVRAAIESGDTALGIELGSTRIKAVLVTGDGRPVATGSHGWNNRLLDGLWTYHLDDVWRGIQDCYGQLAQAVTDTHGARLSTVGALGISAMMHGYLAFDTDGELLVPFRTWRNTNTDRASRALTVVFGHNIPHRWSIAHLYQAVLGGEEHVSRLAHLTTLAGYVHWKLSGENVLGVGDASGMFPIDLSTGEFDGRMMEQFEDLPGVPDQPWRLADLLPAVLPAGARAGTLSEEGARLLDPTGTLSPGIRMCPPEGDAGTGMVATNSVAPRTGNVSAGTSIFAMVVLEHALAGVHSEIDLVTTPAGDPVAMVHCNNGTGDLDAWVGLLAEFAGAIGPAPSTAQVYETLYRAALDGESDGGGLLACNYLSGEPITGLDEGRPLFARTANSHFTLANFMRTHLFAALATLRLGLDVLVAQENVAVDTLFAHGGLFTTRGVGQRLLAAAVKTPVSVGETAGEGGAWGAAVLANFIRQRRADQTLPDYLSTTVFTDAKVDTAVPDPTDADGFDAFMNRYRQVLDLEKAAVTAL